MKGFRRASRRASREKVRGPHNALREFVYLDEVSVFSLVSSLRGSVATDITTSQSDSLLGEVSSSGTASAGVAKASVGARAQATISSGTQVLRKATVQATFRELASDIADRRPLVAEPIALPKLEGTRAKLLKTWKEERLAASVGSLSRGDIFEAKVKLSAEAAYELSAVVGAFAGLSDALSELQNVRIDGLHDAISANALLVALFDGLVPIRGRMVDFVSIEVEGTEWVVHRQLGAHLADETGAELRPIDVVAVAEATSFWRDVRRVLFSESEFTVLARVARSGLQQSWSPIKLSDVVGKVAPEVGSQLSAIAMPSTADTAPSHESERHRLHRALDAFARAITTDSGIDWDETDVDIEVLLDTYEESRQDGIRRLRAPFGQLLANLEERGLQTADRVQVAEIRSSCLQAVGLLPQGDAGPPAAPTNPTPAESAVRLLDTEVIAIYW
jgi:hypothetical protein